MDRQQQTRFVVDVMLGSLVAWLRRLGYDTDYRNFRDDPELVRIARAEDRVLLTRDHELAGRRGVRTLLIESQLLDRQLEQVVSTFRPHPNAPGRCSECNTPLLPATREQVTPLVPSYIAKTHNQFHICPGCQRVYWPGSHWRNIQLRLRQILETVAA